jgi:hypothetical protein
MKDNKQMQDYFTKKYNSENKRIVKFNNALMQLDKTNQRGIRIGKIHIANLYLNCIKLIYSINGSFGIMYEHYLEYLKYYKDICTPNDSMYNIIDMLSIGILLDKNKKQFINDLKEIVNSFGSNDGLIVFLMSYLEGELNNQAFSQISYFNELSESENKEKVLKSELEMWYEEHKDAYWYDSHKSKNDTYCGYWAFEIGALVKILGIDDTDLKDVPYYPYDLVHYKD